MNIKNILLCMVLLLPIAAQGSNLNTISNLVDQGIEPDSTAARTIGGDIPLMEGLQLYHDPNFIPLLPDGDQNSYRTVGVVDVDDIYNYYKKSLPPLGWEATSGRDYARQGKTLHIDARADGKKTIVVFTIN